MYFTGPYLRVTSPKTTNGLIPLIRNGQQVKREDFLPISARKQLEAKNRRLQKNGNNHLVMEIEVVGEQSEAQQTTKRKTKIK